MQRQLFLLIPARATKPTRQMIRDCTRTSLPTTNHESRITRLLPTTRFGNFSATCERYEAKKSTKLCAARIIGSETSTRVGWLLPTYGICVNVVGPTCQGSEIE